MTRVSIPLTIVLALVGLAAGCGTGGVEPTGTMVRYETMAVRLPGSSAPLDANAVSSLVERVKNAVVSINTVATGTPPSPSPHAASPSPSYLIGVGSGFVLRPDGLILTNHHVIAGALRVQVGFADGRRINGKVVADDPITDVALVRVPAKGLQTLPLADPADVRVGQFVVAIGSPNWLEHSVSFGILSAIQRRTGTYARVDYLQTDTAINPGNSGGPLLNLKGEVLGINTWRFEQTASGHSLQNIGFAIAGDTLAEVLPQLERTGKVSHPWLGVRTAVTFDQDHVIFQVFAHSPAEKAGLKVGDVLLTIDGRPVKTPEDVYDHVLKHHQGDAITLGIKRKGVAQAIKVVLGQIPAPSPAP